MINLEPSDRDLALEYLTQPLAVCQDRSHSLWQTQVRNDLGAVYRALGNHQSAFHHHRTALVQPAASGDRYEHAHVDHGSGLVLHGEGDRRGARLARCKALKEFTDVCVPDSDEVRLRLDEAEP